jgi:flagellar assembly protein FliH
MRILRGVEKGRVAATPFTFEIPQQGAGQGSFTYTEQINASREAGYEEGFRAGKAEAEQNAVAERLELLRKTADALQQAASQAAVARADALSVSVVDAIELAFELTETLLQHELSIRESATTDSLARALALVPTDEDLIVHLHPGDALEPSELHMLVPDTIVKIVKDPAVELGGCIVEAGPCRIDAQLGTALQRAREIIDSIAGSDAAKNRREARLAKAQEEAALALANARGEAQAQAQVAADKEVAEASAGPDPQTWEEAS